MNKTIMALAATLLMTSAAVAADLPSRKAAPVAPPPVMSWNGFYVGANAGGSWKPGNTYGSVVQTVAPGYTDGVLTAPGTTVIPNYVSGSSGITGGLQAGYNWQVSPMFVVGAETDFQGTSLGSGSNGNSLATLAYLNNAQAGGSNWVGTSAANQLNWFGTVRGRAGVAVMPNLLVYGTGGFGYGLVQRVGGFYNNNAVQTGWTAGGGVEYKFTPAWSVKGEYLYTDLSGNNQNTWYNAGIGVNNVNNTTKFQTVRAGVNYNFNADWMPAMAKF